MTLDASSFTAALFSFFGLIGDFLGFIFSLL